ncbi:glutamate and aspartate transporter subunit [Plautia stali symbiont]|nr:glutamate and aspartate transporter subunit [Plautia stali symbiont]
MIAVGHRESSVPFSYYDNQQKVVGYSQDYSNAIVAAIKAKLNKPDLQVKMLPITSQNRIPLLQNGTYDFVVWLDHQQRRASAAGGVF